MISAVIAWSFLMSALLSGFSPEIGVRSLANIGAVGLQAAVEPNEFNILAQELRAKEAELGQKENALNERELAILREKNAADELSSKYFMFGAVILFILVLANLYFDFEILHAEKNRPLLSP
jgi:hypothetical protein